MFHHFNHRLGHYAVLFLAAWALFFLNLGGASLWDLDEGRNAGMWTVGVLRTGNMIGLSAEDWAKLGDREQKEKLAHAESLMRERRAHYVINSVAELLPVLNQIEDCIRLGARP